jgi:hypothetical protein
MPYDPRPISKGGNRGIDEPDQPGGFSREAPEGKFRVVMVDTYDGTDGVYKDCDTLKEAEELADEKGAEMLMMHVFDDKGDHLYKAGTF